MFRSQRGNNETNTQYHLLVSFAKEGSRYRLNKTNIMNISSHRVEPVMWPQSTAGSTNEHNVKWQMLHMQNVTWQKTGSRSAYLPRYGIHPNVKDTVTQEIQTPGIKHTQLILPSVQDSHHLRSSFARMSYLCSSALKPSGYRVSARTNVNNHQTLSQRLCLPFPVGPVQTSSQTHVHIQPKWNLHSSRQQTQQTKHTVWDWTDDMPCASTSAPLHTLQNAREANIGIWQLE